jgi:Asp-tRNA(Asn)/Glu-tRNA(Gln) amidotransferase A subunit family amidase
MTDRPDGSFQKGPNRRDFIAFFAGLGLSSTLLPGVLWAQIQERSAKKISKEMLVAAEQIAGLNFTDAQREIMLDGVNNNVSFYEELRRVPLKVSDPPALRFSPILPGMRFDKRRLPFRPTSLPAVTRPENLDDVAFWSIIHLAALIKSRQVSSLELTKMYLNRLKRHDPVLQCVVTLTEDLALGQAHRADAEIAEGKYRGYLHGLPWGAKDLISKKGYRTTWGAAPFKDQILNDDATIVTRLEDAGAVLIAKLTTGELAYWDVWFGGKTKNPWDTQIGSGGSSAGPASATAAGLVGFAIGTETGGSLIEPAIKCGVTTLRPTFGRVSRHGVMPGAWSFDKVGPMCRAAEDCAIVLDAIRGPDDQDMTVIDLPFNWNVKVGAKNLRVGYLKAAFDEEHALPEEKVNDLATLTTLEKLGLQLEEIKMPDYPISAAGLVAWFGEMGSVWDDLIRSGGDAMLKGQDSDGIGNLCRMTRMVPAVESTRASRVRNLIMRATAKIFEEVDVYVAPFSSTDTNPPVAGINLQLTNITGHPAVTVQNGFTKKGLPTGITFIGRLFGEAELLSLAKAYQDATSFHLRHPDI